MRVHSFLILTVLALAGAHAAKVPATVEGSGTTARWTFTSGPATLKSGPKGAGRIISLQYAGSEILHMDTNNATNYGSTFWPSPQAAWKNQPAWPPATNIDGTGAYAATYADTTLVLNGQTDPSNNVRINKVYWANSSDTSFGMKFTIVNTSSSAAAWAPWQDTRIPAGGLYVFPRGVDTATGQLANLIKDTLGYRWFKYDSAKVPTSGTNKFYSDGSGGWFAHVNKNRVLLIKKFGDTPHAKKAPGVEKEIEVYTTNDKKMVEMEMQGPYDTLAAGDSLTWTVKWYVRKLPDSTDVAAANMNIVQYVEKVLAGPVVSVSAPKARQAAGSLGFANRRASFDLPRASTVSLSLVNAGGRTVREIYAGPARAGRHEFAVTAPTPGIYWLTLKVGDNVQIRRVALL